jgi:L-rhamnose mutarotase
MPRTVALHSVLRDGSEDGYDNAHRRIPQELMEAHLRAGITEWRIWRSGRNLFHLVECDDFAHALQLLEADPANVLWQKRIGVFVDHFEVPPSFALGLPLVWGMRQQITETG